ncbi:MAG: squalene--hopene cyclase [Deltaproteobacteria bacterium]|nr:squalene--hopene cyclase [Deltaproteobacteria bacterium]
MQQPAQKEDLDPLVLAISRARDALLKDQQPEGYWWYTLEANESIGAGLIQLMHWLGAVDREIEGGLSQRILSLQRTDGSWALFFDGPPDLSITVECYFSLRLAGFPPDHPSLKKAREKICELGGISQVRVFTKIHLALFGLVPWIECPSMPLWLMQLPLWSGFSIYEFSSWARASIVPLLIILDRKPVIEIPFSLDELKSPPSPSLSKRGIEGGIFFFLDRLLKYAEKLPWHPGKKKAEQLAEKWIREHIERTEDIYPAMAYAALAIKALGYPLSDPTIQKALGGLKRFRQKENLPPSPPSLPKRGVGGGFIHQQCCISPLWDTPWVARTLLESGLQKDDPQLLKAARYLISKQITNLKGDWSQKNRDALPGGWSFEFQNDYFPDVDDTIEILRFLGTVDLPTQEKRPAIERGLQWLLSMQSKNGGWGAFDKNNVSSWVNRIPFSDHGACLDPSTPDITARVLELLADLRKISPLRPPLLQRGGLGGDLKRALNFLLKTQEPDGSWRGRWGVNFIYGTWAVLVGLTAIGISKNDLRIRKAVHWLKSIQNPDGGWGESCLSDREGHYVPLGLSLPSQTAWALLGLIAAGGDLYTEEIRRGVEFLINSQDANGRWEERHFTGTGFPGHFYIRYHGYQQYFPLLALGRYSQQFR